MNRPHRGLQSPAPSWACSPGEFAQPGRRAAVGSGRRRRASGQADHLCLTQSPKGQVRKGRARGLRATSFGWRFRLWSLGLFCPERRLARCLKNNSFFPFEQQQPNVFVLEYYQDTLWKGMLLLAVCVVLVSVSSLRKVRAPGPPPPPSAPAGPPCTRSGAPRGARPQVQKQETWVFPAYGVAVGLWMVVSSLPRRRLVLNHPRGVYHFSIQGRAVCQGPLHLVYVRLASSSDAYGRCFFQLVLGGHRLEPLVLVQLSEHYEQMEYLGRYMARKLNINYFDYLATSYRHVVRHWPPSSTRSVSHKSLVDKASSSQSNLEV
ncbi:transmembrane protein 249 [Cebus imitator]|uniref:transmembrane protein 249 n=1 Tax=Cebus imitator TaxID=2715852 RepID=UPI0018985B31|nr:transmembrane protein 249 [Cebus imitator]